MYYGYNNILLVSKLQLNNVVEIHSILYVTK